MATEQLINWNHLTSSHVSEGARLKVGPNPTAQTAAENLVRIQHTVQRGESVSGISRQYNIPMDTIVKLNNIKDYLIHPGQSLVIQDVAQTAAKAGTYIVEKGDYLYKIAQQFQTTVDNIKKCNGLKSNWIYSGQELITSAAGATAASLSGYTVAQGDTLWSIAQRFETTVDNLMKWSCLQNHLILPNKEHNGFVHVKDQNNKFRLRTERSDNYTDFPHIHFEDPSLPPGFQYDINGMVVPSSSPGAHTPWGGIFN